MQIPRRSIYCQNPLLAHSITCKCIQPVSVGVSRMGKTGVIFIEPGAKVNSSYYCEHVLGEGLLPGIRAKCGRYRWILHSSARRRAIAHCKTTMNFLKMENVSFIEPQMWPPNSPDLNRVNYAVRSALQQQVYHNRKFITVDQLKQATVQ